MLAKFQCLVVTPLPNLAQKSTCVNRFPLVSGYSRREVAAPETVLLQLVLDTIFDNQSPDLGELALFWHPEVVSSFM
jgi:hypothetical protein